MGEPKAETSSDASDDTVMGIRMTKREREEISEAAAADGFRIATEWVRVQLKTAVKRALASQPDPAPAGSDGSPS